MHKPEAILFDMDGTLTDTEKIWYRAEVEVLARYGAEITPEVSKGFIGCSLMQTAETVRSQFNIPASATELAQELTSTVEAIALREGMPWRPGAYELLENLLQWGIPSALVTSSYSSFAKQALRQAPAGSLEVVITGDTSPYAKPHPMPYQLAAYRLGVDIKNCIVFEDSIPGFTSGARSGAITVGIPFQVELPNIPGTHLLESLTMVTPQYLSELMQQRQTVA